MGPLVVVLAKVAKADRVVTARARQVRVVQATAVPAGRVKEAPAVHPVHRAQRAFRR
jgi:hypothetical protein